MRAPAGGRARLGRRAGRSGTGVGTASGARAAESSSMLSRLTVALALVALLALTPHLLAAQDLVIRGGEVWPVSGPPVAEGVVVIRNGRIVDVVSGGIVNAPAGVETVDATNRVVTPGFIDARTDLGVTSEGAVDRRRLVREEVRVADHLERPDVPGVFGMEGREYAVHPWLADGVTTVYVAPSPGNLVGAHGAVLKLGDDGFGAVVDSAAALHVALGQGPLDVFDVPTTRQGMVAVLRQWLLGVRARMEGRPAITATAGEDEEVPVPASVGRDLAAVLRGERPVRFHAHAPDDIRTALRVARELELRAVVEGAAGAWVVADDLARAGVPVVVGPSMVGLGSGGPAEMYAHTAENAARLVRAGVPVALSTDGARGRSVTVEAVVARGHGLAADQALRALTLDAARILGVDGRVGSLEAGKDADLVVWEGDPVGTWGRAMVVVVDGRVVYRRDEAR